MLVSTCGAAFPADWVLHASGGQQKASAMAQDRREGHARLFIWWSSPVVAPRSLWSDQTGAPHQGRGLLLITSVSTRVNNAKSLVNRFSVSVKVNND